MIGGLKMKTRFKELRLKLGLTQEDFRQKFNNMYHRNYTPSAISRFENDKRIPETAALIDFADFFNVSIDTLLCHETKGNFPAQNTGEILTQDTRALIEKYAKLTQTQREYIQGFIDILLNSNTSKTKNHQKDNDKTWEEHCAEEHHRLDMELEAEKQGYLSVSPEDIENKQEKRA